jgi:hypothetical protein
MDGQKCNGNFGYYVIGKTLQFVWFLSEVLNLAQARSCSKSVADGIKFECKKNKTGCWIKIPNTKKWQSVKHENFTHQSKIPTIFQIQRIKYTAKNWKKSWVDRFVCE